MNDRGRVTLPAETLEAMGWRPGQSLRLTVSNGAIVIEPYPKTREPLRS
ncbi:AbrB/MazE/SpoVT family DNA-binding domain-containing protein [Sphingomonas sp. BT553]|uniref:AbrB/MazE/SpoVT family DNA-binding domain-containing protein n=2 Tax=Sphingomonas mollis TaxID=2795726 RepID=A0ABS0XQI7_9SPHN|nr:AbrB/MazE/SpoVT family DNA-binding domain-containing protein [Sphingomonas sp. BT553]